MKLRSVHSNEPISVNDTFQGIDLCDRCNGHGKVIYDSVGLPTRGLPKPEAVRCEQCRGAGRTVRTLTFSYVDNTLT